MQGRMRCDAYATLRHFIVGRQKTLHSGSRVNDRSIRQVNYMTPTKR